MESEYNSSYILRSKIVKTGKILKNTTLSQIKEYEEKFSKIIPLYSDLFKDLIIDKYNIEEAIKSVKQIFGKKTLSFVAIDGTEYSKPLFDMIIFYASACSCDGEIDLTDNDFKIKYRNKFLDNSSDISSCIPLYIDKIPEIDRTFHDEDGEVDLTKSSTEEDIIKNTNIATFLMTFSEFYLAYKYASEKKFDIILMDMSLSNMYSSLLYDTSNRKAWNTNLSIMNYHIDGHQVDINDLTIARYSLINDKLNLPPDRGNYLRYKIITLLSSYTDEISLDQIMKELNIIDNKRTRNKIKRFIDATVNEGIFLENKYKGTYIIKSKYRSTWKRIRKTVQEIGNKIFNDEEEPFILKNEKGVKRLLTSLDISFLTLFSLYLLIEECWKNNILLIGITKDTTAQEFKNHVIPICLRNKIWNYSCERIENNLVNAPNTDRMLLQSISVLNHEKINVPWSLIEYDAAFVTTVPDFQKRKGL